MIQVNPSPAYRAFDRPLQNWPGSSCLPVAICEAAELGLAAVDFDSGLVQPGLGEVPLATAVAVGCGAFDVAAV